MGTAEFLKPPGIDTKGYESGLNKQWISLNKYATVGLRGAGPTGERLTVSLNNPAIGTIAEQAPQTNLRILRVTGKAIGHAMMEAKSRSGQVIAFMQIQVVDVVKVGKSIMVDLKNQKLQAFLGMGLVFDFECVTGDATHPTDVGKFTVLRKAHPYRSKTYDVQMDYAIFFTNDGKAIHQYHGVMGLGVVRTLRTAASDWFGSHGCVRLREEDAKRLYSWADSTTSIEVR